LLSLPFVLAAVWDLCIDTSIMPDVVSWLSLCFFGAGIPIGIYQLFDKRPKIIINEIGIFDRDAYTDYITWNSIADAYLTSVYQQKFICLVIKEEFKHLIKSKKPLKSLLLQLGFQEVNISLGPVGSVKENKLLNLILAMRNAEPAERINLLNI